MMSKITKTLIVVWIVTMVFSAVAWADGAPPTDRIPVPDVREYPLIHGTFTVSYRQFEATPKFFDIHVVLKRFGTTKTFLIERTVSRDSVNICEYENLSMDALIHKYQYDPRSQDVEVAFGLVGLPVITELKILKSDNCDDKRKAMLYGTLKIRIMPN